MSPARWSSWRRVGGAAVLAVVVARVGSGGVLDGLRSLDPGVLLLGTGIGLLTTLACALRWRLVARELGVSIDLAPAVAACYRAQLLNAVLPGGVLGDVHRGVAHGRTTGETGRALRAVGWERFGGQVVQAVVAAIVLLVLPSPVRPLLPGALVLAAVLLVGTAMVVLVAPDADAGWIGAARVARDDVRLCLLVGRSWPGVVAASLVALGGYAATYVVAARAVGVDAPVWMLVPLVLAVLVVAGVPLNVAGWGPREGMAAWVFAAAGLGAGAGVASSVAYGAIVLVANLPGVVVLLCVRARAAPEVRQAGGRVHV